MKSGFNGAALVCAVVLIAFAAGCIGGSSPPAGPGPAQSKTTVARAITKVLAQDSPLGRILVDEKGITLYMFDRDNNGIASCYDQCAKKWPPLVAKGDIMRGEGVPGRLNSIERSDGLRQVAYNDIPLYYYAEDKAPGDVKGQGVNGMWFVLNPLTGPVYPPAEATGSTQPAQEPPATLAQTSTSSPATTAAAGAPGQFIAKASDVPPGSTFEFAYGGDKAILVNFGGQYAAYMNKCTHKGGPGVLEGGVIRCQWHGAEFNPSSGAVLKGPATAPLTPVEVLVYQGGVYAK